MLRSRLDTGLDWTRWKLSLCVGAVGIMSYHQEDPPSPSQDQIDLSFLPSLMISENLISPPAALLAQIKISQIGSASWKKSVLVAS